MCNRTGATSTITIITSPPMNASNLPNNSPTKQAPVYRIEERSRTIYVASDVDPAHWDTNSLDAMFNLAETSDTRDGNSKDQPIRRTQSYQSTQILSSPEPTPTVDRNSGDESAESSASSPRYSDYSTTRRQAFRKSVGPGFATPNARVPLTNVASPYLSPQQPQSRPRGKILFYHKTDPFYGFTNFSSHPVTYKGRRYPTSEHLFQSFKFQDHRPNLAEHIRTCSERPSVAFSEARRFQPEVRPDWKQVNIEKMDITLYHKFTQHADLRDELLSTRDAELVEDSDKDAFWGVGADGRGRNELGKALERLRAQLRGSP